jgi:hypothetical protein
MALLLLAKNLRLQESGTRGGGRCSVNFRWQRAGAWVAVWQSGWRVFAAAESVGLLVAVAFAHCAYGFECVRVGACMPVCGCA